MRPPSYSKADRSHSTPDKMPLLRGERGARYESLPSSTEPQVVSWASIPNKGQLAVLVLARLAEPLSERSLTSYLFYQLQWFNPTLDASEIAKQTGYITAIFATAQCITSMWWGHLADSPRLGRKRVLVIGLVGSSMSALGMGFSRSLYVALFFRFMAGALNGNVGVLRTMISEIIVDERYQSRAFLLLPMCFNVGVIIGPLLSGFLADPIHSLPSIFGPGSLIGGNHGVQWMIKFPYLLPNLVCSIILSTAAFGIILGLDETHPHLRHRLDRGRQLGNYILSTILKCQKSNYSYQAIPNGIPSNSSDQLPDNDIEERQSAQRVDKPTLPFRAIFTRNVCLSLLLLFLQTVHVSAFNAIFFTLLPTPRAKKGNIDNLPFHFTGGLGLSSKKIGFANTTIGIIGIPLQLILYPLITARLGVRKSYRTFLPLSIVAYCLLPYIMLLPNDAVLIWISLSIVLMLHVTSRTFVNPATVILVNDSAPDPTLLGTVHGFASSVSSAARIVGPTMGGGLLGWGLSHNFVGLPLWTLGILAMANWILLLGIQEVKLV